MKKLKLEIEDLAIESFDTSVTAALPGTVQGYFSQVDTCSMCQPTCIATACETCNNSLDYCTCDCTAACTDACTTTRTRYSPDPCIRNQEP